MQLRLMATILLVSGFLVGCGFVPKKPPKPNTTNRVAVNQAPPYPRPLLPQRATPIKHDFTPPQVPPGINSTATLPVEDKHQEREDPQIKSSDNTVAPKENDKTTPPNWPVFLAFNPKSTLATAFSDIGFSWPSATGEARTSKDEPEPTLVSTPSTPVQGPETINQETVATASVTDETSMVVSESDEHVALVIAPSSADLVESNSGDTSPSLDFTAPEQTPAIESPAPRKWVARASTSLSDVLHEWALEDEWTLNWNSTEHFIVDAEFMIEADDFLAAANRLLAQLTLMGCEFPATAYSNQVLNVSTPKNCKL